MNEQDQFYDKVGRENGWDFSKVKVITEGASWDFYNDVRQLCKPSDLLLDIGTGGGESLLTIADAALLLVGIDLSGGMIETAKSNLERADHPNVRLLQMDAGKLEFPAGFFNIVSSRHSIFHAKEIAKVLADNGVFLTQQVSENDKLNLKQAFGRGQAVESTSGALKKRCIAELREAGFSDIQSFEYNADEYYETPEDLVFLLKHTPIIPDFGRTQEDMDILKSFIADNQTDKGIRTNSARFMLVARK